MEELDKRLDEVIDCIMNSSEYKTCLELKNKMSEDKEITELVKKIKTFQKKYIRSNFDNNIKNELNELESRLNDIPLYIIYMNNLEKVNHKINYVRDTLNDYFYNLLNKKY